MSKSKLDLISIEKLKTIILNNSRFSCVLKEIGYVQLNDKRTIQKIKDKCKQYNIDYSHIADNSNTKICNVCGQEKNINEYYIINGRILSCCKDCQKEKERNKYKKRTEELDRYKQNFKCVKCGEGRFYLLDFHHKDPKEKDFNISDHSRASLDTLKNEIEKCDILCSNCHREWHYLSLHKNLEYDAWLGEKA